MFISHCHWDPRCETKHCHQLYELLLLVQHTGNLFGLHSSWSWMCEAKNSVHDEAMKWNWKVQKSARILTRENASISTSTYKKSLKPPNWMSPVVCMVWYPGLHYCPNHRTAPANEADIIRNKTAVTNQIHKQRYNCCWNTGWDMWWWWPLHNGRYHS